MVRPLTKTTSDGALYVRPPEVERQIAHAVTQDVDTLAKRTAQAPDHPEYLRPECLVHLIREGRRTNNVRMMEVLFPMFLKRCEASLLGRVNSRIFSKADEIRQSVLDALTELFFDPNHEEQLDFYECRFNLAFQALRITELRRSNERPEVAQSQIGSATDGSGAFDTGAGVFDNRPGPPFTTGPDERAERVRAALRLLDPDEQRAFALRHLGYPVESINPATTTIATLCGVSGRAIRARLASVDTKLAQLREEA